MFLSNNPAMFTLKTATAPPPAPRTRYNNGMNQSRENLPCTISMNTSFLQDFSDAELRGIRGVSELRFDSDVQWSEQQIHRLSKIWDVNEVFIERNQNVKAFENHFADTPISFFEY